MSTQVLPAASSAAVHRTRCLRCRVSFPVGQPAGPCYIHPGEYSNALNMIRTWSCCRSADEGARGCKALAQHTEDVEYTKQLLSLESDIAQAGSRAPAPAAATLTGVAAFSPAELQEAPNPTSVEMDAFWSYAVRSTDTLQGISLHFGVDIETLQRVNRLHDSRPSTLFTRKTLLIPNAPALVRTLSADSLQRLLSGSQVAGAVSRTRVLLPAAVSRGLSNEQQQLVVKCLHRMKESVQRADVAAAEDPRSHPDLAAARFYLECHAWNVDQALQEWANDHNWEAQPSASSSPPSDRTSHDPLL